jgi:hypothetical protein
MVLEIFNKRTPSTVSRTEAFLLVIVNAIPVQRIAYYSAANSLFGDGRASIALAARIYGLSMPYLAGPGTTHQPTAIRRSEKIPPVPLTTKSASRLPNFLG